MSTLPRAGTLREALDEAIAERDYFASLAGAFLTGQVPDQGASLQHHIFAQWGRKRLEHNKVTASLLRSPEA